VKNGLEDSGHFISIPSYLKGVVKAIEDSKYKLSDFPELFFSYNNFSKRDLASRLGNLGFAGSIRYASDGYSQLLLKHKSRARELFYMALAGDPDQAAVHYYLSKVTDGDLARYHLARAAEIGYYKAVREYAIIKK
jgi:hypothetical protein